ncbi:MAG: acyltransferase family protein [Spirochaetales bacterium]|nr:acyltransferase family protein [Spirochaetales bacterium]
MKQRLYFLDSIKVFLTILVVAHHVSIAYGGAAGWYIMDPQRNEISTLLITFFLAINQAYFMSFFFFISAYFSPQSCERKGPLVFMKDRLVRLGIPLLVFYLLLNPLLIYFLYLYYGYFEGSFFRFWAGHLSRSAGAGPLWFVQALLCFSLVYALVKLISRKGRRPVGFPSVRVILMFLMLAAFAAFVIRIFLPVDKEIIGFKLGYFPLYILFFTAGILARNNGWLDSLDRKKARPWFIIAILSILLLPVVVLLTDGAESFSGGVSLRSVVYSLWEPFVCIGLIMQFLVVFRKRANNPGIFGRELARTAFAVYIFHPFFCVGAAILLMPLPLFPLLKFAIGVVLAVVSSFVFGSIIVRIPLIKRVI